ncbi:hypothetical protein J4439_07950 [Candidatus Woesearchaeota archaeon]|nr:hypothetical protein [Candidatus Woesearchaeota archaeon]
MTRTIEVGSLPKLPGRASKLAGKPITPAEEEQLNEVLRLVPAQRLKLLVKEHLALVSKPGKPDASERQRLVELNSAFNIALLEEIGLDDVYDGEAHRSEMYAGIATQVSGLKQLSWQVSFMNADGDPNIFRPYMYEGKLGLRNGPVHDNELRYVLSKAQKAVKICVTGAYTMGTWTDPGVLLPRYRKERPTWTDAWQEAQAHLVDEFATRILNPTVKSVAGIQVGGKRAARIQIDEPNATKIRADDERAIEVLRKSIVSSIRGAKAEFGLHVCFSHDYAPIAKVCAAIPEIRFVTLEIANGDPGDLSNYEKALRPFMDAGYDGQLCIGAFAVHSNEIESAELIAKRASYAAELVGNSSRIELAPDCGLRTRVLPVAVRKLQEMVRAARLLDQRVVLPAKG